MLHISHRKLLNKYSTLCVTVRQPPVRNLYAMLSEHDVHSSEWRRREYPQYM